MMPNLGFSLLRAADDEHLIFCETDKPLIVKTEGAQKWPGRYGTMRRNDTGECLRHVQHTRHRHDGIGSSCAVLRKTGTSTAANEIGALA